MATKKKAASRKRAGKKATPSKSLKKKSRTAKSSKASGTRKLSSKKAATGTRAKKTRTKKAATGTRAKTARTKKASKKVASGGTAASTSGAKTARARGTGKKASRKVAGKASKKGRKPAPARREAPPRRRLSTFADAVKLYEAAVRLMHRDKYAEARAEFARLSSEYPNETELLDRANVLDQVCENRLQDSEPRLKGGNEYYDVGVAKMNDGELDEAQQHLEQALKLLPTADHVLYALAALFALRGDRERAMDYLARSVERRTENRFQAANDDDFAALADDPDFIRLLASKSS